MQVLIINELKKNICHIKFNFNTTGTLLKLNHSESTYIQKSFLKL